MRNSFSRFFGLGEKEEQMEQQTGRLPVQSAELRGNGGK